MRVLIVYTYPNPNGLNAAIFRGAVAGLEEAGIAYDVIDLYGEHFNPVLIFNKDSHRAQMKDDPDTAHYRELVAAADHLIFIYPTWWSGMPAMLRGFFDRVFASGFAYAYRGLYPHGLLNGKSATLIYTMDGPAFYARLIRRSSEWHAVKGPIFHFCGIQPVRRLVLYGVRHSTVKKRKHFLEHVHCYCAQLS
ncbi:MAG: NAD(P)H-dependent oxidoreductase [Sporolactobacillus sp.]